MRHYASSFAFCCLCREKREEKLFSAVVGFVEFDRGAERGGKNKIKKKGLLQTTILFTWLDLHWECMKKRLLTMICFLYPTEFMNMIMRSATLMHNNQSMPLSVREWQCPSCLTVHDRDINAAKNIRLIGLADSPGHGDCVKSPSVAILVSASASAKGVESHSLRRSQEAPTRAA